MNTIKSFTKSGIEVENVGGRIRFAIYNVENNKLFGQLQMITEFNDEYTNSEEWEELPTYNMVAREDYVYVVTNIPYDVFEESNDNVDNEHNCNKEKMTKAEKINAQVELCKIEAQKRGWYDKIKVHDIRLTLDGKIPNLLTTLRKVFPDNYVGKCGKQYTIYYGDKETQKMLNTPIRGLMTTSKAKRDCKKYMNELIDSYKKD